MTAARPSTRGGTATDNEQMHFTNITAAPFDVLVQVLGYGTGFTCNTYMLSVAITPTANGCLSSTDDIYEPNDSCASAPILPFGMYMGLIASKDPNPDWYALLVPGGTAIDVQLQYPPDVQANVELRLYEDCNDSPIATGDGVGGALVVSFQNFSALAQTYYIKVNIWSFAQLDCNSYELGLTLVGGNMFTNYCAGDGTAATCPCGNLGGGGEGSANSSGGGAKLSATGTNFVQLDDMRLDARGLLPGQPALLFSGENAPGSGQGVPFGDGLRCAGTNVIRHGVPSPEALGEAAWPAGLVAQNGWGAGDQRHFQVWYRDPVGSACGAGFNLSSAVETTFVP